MKKATNIKKKVNSKKLNASASATTNSKKVTTKEKPKKSNNGTSKPPKIKKEKTSAPKEKSVKKSPTKNKGNENSDSTQTLIPGICEENITKSKPISKSKDKDLNDRVKNRIKLMLSSASSSDIPFVGKDLEKLGKSTFSSNKVNQSLESKKSKKLETKKQNGITKSGLEKEPAGSSKKRSKPPSPKKTTNSSKKSSFLLSEALTENSKGSPNVSTTKNDRKSSCGIKKHPLISPKSSDAKVKSKQVTTKTVTSEKEKMKKK